MTLTGVPLSMRRQKLDKLCSECKMLCPRLTATKYCGAHVPRGVDAYASRLRVYTSELCYARAQRDDR